jgi:hypothetical protein
MYMLDPWKNLYVARTLLTAAHEDVKTRTDCMTIELLIDEVEDLIDDAMMVIGGPASDETDGKPEQEDA